MKRSHNTESRREGVTAVEFALTFPLLLLFLFATYELGRANMMLNTCEAAAYEGARVAIVPGATTQEAQEIAESVLATAGIRNATINVTPSDLTVDSDNVVVEITFGFRENMSLGNFVMPDGAIISRACELVREKL